MEIINEAHNQWNTGSDNYEFIKKASMGDIAIHTRYGSVQEGIITMINRNGINVSTNWGDRFIKWHHVLKIRKTVL